MSDGKHSKTVRLLHCNSHFSHVSNVNALFKAYRCPSCDQFNNTVRLQDLHLTTHKEGVTHVFPKNV